ncbi:RNA polymerase sigma-70 factor (TIGR02952 family) [Jatrophihabitans sp. GAS493]|uniref:sigma-70 family RNA polymerase sigma factor n=1 Tax=Jatrophihabitans sp. GAS493 TaxID=1907575 RepID=UPI000BBF3EB0|nr:sigma-70 family RNA polymerase sigma factor [Jatrophihabitans sp. GAS493]SOD70660.1 RNA polymerase sigma-70 factor (TIGR02952 family) [Jatrophihabitans sp. GAS493]
MRDATTPFSLTRGRTGTGNPLTALRLELVRALLSSRLVLALPGAGLAGAGLPSSTHPAADRPGHVPGHWGMTAREIRSAVPRLPFGQAASSGAHAKNGIGPDAALTDVGGGVEGVEYPDRQDDSDEFGQPMDAEHAETWLLVKRAQGGDGEAFGALYDRYVDSVFRFIFYRVHDQQLAEDFTSETFLRALRRIGVITYQGRDIGAWFMTIARNIVLDHVKSARNRLEFTTGEIVEDDRSEPSPETAVLTMLSNDRLMAAVNALGDEQRECVVLRFIQGLSVAETAEIMGKKEGAIKALQHRAVRKLATDVAGELT